jgi:Cu(I)/Ag(I) efflux system membrane fusion protein
VSGLPGRVWEGEVEYIYPELDPKSRTLKVRLAFDNPEGC